MPGHHGPAYSAQALLTIDEFAAAALLDLDANGIEIGQIHAEYGPAQVEISLAATDPVTAADHQVLARQTLRAAARRHGLRVSFAPLISPDGVGNGCHIHSSVWRGEDNLLRTGDDGRPAEEGASFLAGLLRDLPALVAVTAPSVPSLTRLRPGYFASAFAFWGVENREAALRYVPSTDVLGAGHANVELKPADASANPYLALAVLIGSGLAGIDDGLALGDPVAADPGGWSDEDRANRRHRSSPNHARRAGAGTGEQPAGPRGPRRAAAGRVHRRPAGRRGVGAGPLARRDHRRAPVALLSSRGGGDQDAGGQRQHVDARPQRSVVFDRAHPLVAAGLGWRGA